MLSHFVTYMWSTFIPELYPPITKGEIAQSYPGCSKYKKNKVLYLKISMCFKFNSIYFQSVFILNK